MVICPPLGAEQPWAYATLRRLAERLTADGFAVLRIDYAGTGESGGDLQTAWPTGGLRTSLAEAVTLIRNTGVDTVALVGMRLGATLVGDHALAHPVDVAVLWDPVVSGRAYLREQRAAAMLSAVTDPALLADEDRTGIEVPGFRYGQDGVDDLRSLNLEAGGAHRPTQTLVLGRPSMSDRSRGAIEGSFAPSWETAIGQEELFTEKVIPNASLEAIARWLGDAVPDERTDLSLPTLARETVVGCALDGSPITERTRLFGPNNLFGVTTEAASVGKGPVVVFLDVAAEPPIGPGRLWVDMSRHLAASGIRCVRFNCSGLGDSPPRVGLKADVVYAPEAIQDVIDLAKVVSPDDPSHVILMGLCSGAYNAIEAGIALHAAGVCCINPILDAPILDGSSSNELRVAARPRRRWIRAIGDLAKLDGIRTGLPPVAWRVLDRLRVVASPASGLVPLVEGGTRLLLVCGPDDGRRFNERGGWIMRRLARTGRLWFAELPSLDHSLLQYNQRDVVRTLLNEHIFRLSDVPAWAVEPSTAP